jgi:DNA invertase Pin-like site-specific DNA recombinase
MTRSEQKDHRAALAKERARLLATCREFDWREMEIQARVEFSSEERERQPGLRTVLETLERGKRAGLAVYTFGAPAHRLSELGTLAAEAHDRGWSLAGLESREILETPYVEVWAAFAPVAADLVAQRAREGLARRRAAGGRIGRPQTLPRDVVSRIVEAHLGGSSLSAIARELNAERVPTAQGGAQWHPSTVKAVLGSQAAQELVDEVDAIESITVDRATGTHVIKTAKTASRGEVTS